MNVTLLDGGTTATTGGTSQLFSESGETVANGRVLVDAAEADYFSREKIICTSRLPARQSDGSYSKQKTKVQYVVPEIAADGEILYHLVRNEIEVHPKSADAAAMLAKLREMGAQLYKDSELNALYTTGSF